MNTPEQNTQSDLWQDLLDETFGSSDDTPQDTPADISQEPAPVEAAPPEPEEPVKKVRKFYKKPVFWLSCAVATVLIVLLIAIAPTLLAFNMWPQLKECKNALDEFKKLDCYRLISTSYQVADNDMQAPVLEKSSRTITRCDRDWLYLNNVYDNNQSTLSVLLRKSDKYYSQAYDSSANIWGTPLEPCAPQSFPKFFPLTFSWYGKKIQLKDTTYRNDSLETVSISVTELFSGLQYDLTFYLNSDGSLRIMNQSFTDERSSNAPLMITHTISTTDKNQARYFIDTYFNLSPDLSTE